MIQHSGRLKNVYLWSQQVRVTVVRNPKFCSKTESFPCGIFHSKTDLFELRDTSILRITVIEKLLLNFKTLIAYFLALSLKQCIMPYKKTLQKLICIKQKV